MIPRLHVSFRFISVFRFTLSLSRWTIFGMLIHCSCFPTHSMCLFTHIKCLTCKVKFWSIRLKSIVRPFIEWLSQPVCVCLCPCVCECECSFIMASHLCQLGARFSLPAFLISSHHNTSHLISAHCRANDYELREGESLANWARCYAFNLINAFDTFFHRSKSLIKWNQRHGCFIIDGPENICARHRIRPQQRSETIWMIKLNRLMFRSFPCVTRIYIASSQCHWKSVEWKSKMSVQWAKMSPIDFGQKSNQPKQSTWVGKKSERRVYWEII